MFMNEIYDGYMKQRLLDVALSRKNRKTFMKPSLPAENITKIDECKFTVLGEISKEMQYNVDLSTGTCDCVCGQTGRVCKHMIACGETAVINLPQVLEDAAENRQWLAVANGTEKLPSVDLFSVKIEIGPEFLEDASLSADHFSSCNIPVGPSVKETVLACTTTHENVSGDAIGQAENAIKREAPTQKVVLAAGDLFYNTVEKLGDSTTDESLEVFMRALKSLKTTNQLHSFLHSFGSSS
ncbi:hypothetical protein GWK47_044694 [Chionoecetes opilio]|uniref:SWIM-type domain-containing protein n=1 Tax=Chionoecetes opilio TaxID=41210 RepID=A0A8J4YIZ2_CHIOP|nr:hypothetical protein GWK47_044694 [Chionoecetes opilio]